MRPGRPPLPGRRCSNPPRGLGGPRLDARRDLLDALERHAGRGPAAERAGLSAARLGGHAEGTRHRAGAAGRVRERYGFGAEPVAVGEGGGGGNGAELGYARQLRGQNLLLARRLVEAGVPFVNVYDFRQQGQNWDAHFKCANQHKTHLLPQADRALSALIEDLDERGLLDTTLVVAMGEFGRTPKINGEGGRDHWPRLLHGPARRRRRDGRGGVRGQRPDRGVPGGRPGHAGRPGGDDLLAVRPRPGGRDPRPDRPAAPAGRPASRCDDCFHRSRHAPRARYDRTTSTESYVTGPTRRTVFQPSRRELLRAGLAGFGCLSLPGLLRLRAQAAPAGRTADGGHPRLAPRRGSHLETLRPQARRPGRVPRARSAPSPRRRPGLRVGELLPRQAAIAGPLHGPALDGPHRRRAPGRVAAAPLRRPGRRRTSSKPVHPDFMSVANYLRAGARRPLPNYVGVNPIVSYDNFTIAGPGLPGRVVRAVRRDGRPERAPTSACPTSA